MQPTILEMILSQCLYFGIASMCAYTAWSFYLFKDGRLRILVIRLFLALSIAFTIEGLYWLTWDFGLIHTFQPIWLRLIKNSFLLVCLFQFVQFAKGKR